MNAAKSWAEDGGESGYTDAMELLDLGLHLIGDESEEVDSSSSSPLPRTSKLHYLYALATVKSWYKRSSCAQLYSQQDWHELIG